MTTSPRFRRGDASPLRPGLLFFRFKRGREIWVTRERFEKERAAKKVIEARGRKKPENKIKARNYMRSYQRQPARKSKHAAYYSRRDVLDRINAKYASDPKRLIEAQERERKKAERSAYVTSPEYRELQRQKSLERYQQNRTVIIAKAGERRRNSPDMRLKQNVSRRIRKALRRQHLRKSEVTLKLLGCTIHEFRLHLQRQFTEGMTWENMGEWELDHRVPLAAFQLADPEQRTLAFNFHNLRPLWKSLNRQKSDKIYGVSVRSSKSKIIPFREVA